MALKPTTLWIGLVSLLAMQAQAEPVTLTAAQQQSSEGRRFTFIFDRAPRSDGTGGILTLQVSGGARDGGLADVERLTWDIDGLVGGGLAERWIDAGDWSGPVGLSDPVVSPRPGGDYQLTRSFLLPAADMLAIAADGVISVLVSPPLESAVEPIEKVAVTLKYNQQMRVTPSPDTLALVGLALVILAFRLKRRFPANPP